MAQRQYYIATQAAIDDPFVPPPDEDDLCQCLNEGGVWRYVGGVWTLAAALEVFGIPIERTWGTITGTLSNQTDLQTVLDSKGTSDFSGAYNDLTGKPTLGTAAATAIGDYATSAQGVTADSAVQPARTVNGHALSSDVTVTKGDVGLSNADNTSDSAKPISTATQTALDAKQSTLVSATNIKSINGASVLGSGDLTVSGAAAWGDITGTLSDQSDLQTELNLKATLASPTFTGTVAGVTSAMVGLGNADNTSDASKPVSTATQTALNLKANLASPTFTGTVAGVTATMVGLGSVNNTSDASKPVSTATQTALDLKSPLLSPTLTGTPAAPVAANNTDTTQIATTSFVRRANRSAIGTADLAIANTETVVCQVVCAANELVAGTTFMFRAYATRAGTQSIASVTRIRVGTTALTGNIAATCTTPADALAVPHILEGMVTIRTAGSGGTVLGSIGVEVHLAAVTITKAINPLAVAVAVDTTAANMIIALTFISGHASNTWTFRNAVMWRVN